MILIDDKLLLLSLIKEGATLITPNNRLSNELLNDFLKANPQPVQDKPQCLPYSSFLQYCFKKLCHKQPQHVYPLLLTSQQLRHWWRQILTQQIEIPINEGLLEAIAKTWSSCHSWQLDLRHPEFAYTDQTQQFQQAALKLQQELGKMEALTEDALASYLTLQDSYYGRKTLIWACFDDYTPQQRQLQNYLIEKGCKLYHYDLAKQENLLYQYEAPDERDEQQQLIHWLTRRFDRGDKRIAIIVPDLLVKARPLQRLLQQQFSQTEFTISLGQTLAEYPLVAHALCWLSLDGSLLSNQQLKLLLHSPYLAYSEEEMLPRAQFMEESTILQESYTEQAILIKQLIPTAPKLANLLTTVRSYPTNEEPVQKWIELFKSRLTTLGFPGQYSISSEVYQCYQRFLLLFDEFKQLALVTPVMTQQQALNAFRDLAKHTIFQPKNSTARIHVLGLLEAAGCTFDSLWVTGLTDECLPQKVKPSAFIPIPLQQKNLMPHASPIRELQLAQKILTRLKNSSPCGVFSYPHFSGDKPNVPSPLIAGLEPLPIDEKPEAVSTQLVESFSEDYQIPLTLNERVLGGTAILANQAKCPFQAFAAHRLQAKPPLLSSEGPNAQERGQLIHKVMELLWQALQNQQTLLTLTDQQLTHSIEQAIQSALEPLIKQRRHSFSNLIQEVELIRLKRLVHAFLDRERQRPPFTVEALEQIFTLNLGGIDFRLRVDRIDRVEHNKKWIIDYKSRFPQTLPWKEDRPQEPQLLLYALLNETINTILFAQLKTGEVAYKGISEEDNTAIGIMTLKKDENWTSFRQRWQQQLQDLAEEFSRGYCPPKPAKPTICQQCSYQNLCRFSRS